jgi:hypothetical protein
MSEISCDSFASAEKWAWSNSAATLDFLPRCSPNSSTESSIRRCQHSRVKGKLALKVGSGQEILEAGDSLYFDSQLPHGYSRLGTKACSAIVVTAE